MNRIGCAGGAVCSSCGEAAAIDASIPGGRHGCAGKDKVACPFGPVGRFRSSTLQLVHILIQGFDPMCWVHTLVVDSKSHSADRLVNTWS